MEKALPSRYDGKQEKLQKSNFCITHKTNKKEVHMDTTHQTYTYTARSVEDPDRVVTFTLDNGHMRVNLTGLMEQAGKIKEADETGSEIKTQLMAQAGPVMSKVAEELSEPVHISDVHASLSDENLRITLWHRLAGLRLAPMVFNMGQIDNEPAAEAFVEELEQRQEKEAHAGKFFGPLDYWLGWIGMVFAVVFLIRWPGRKSA